MRGREIDLRLPTGVADAKPTDADVDATPATTSTGGSWRTRTVSTLLALMEGRGA